MHIITNKVNKMTDDILWFKDISRKDIPKVGGKGANLGEMKRNGFPIPDGFCVTAQAYERFLEKTEIKEFVEDILSDLDVEDTQKLQIASEEIHNLILNAQMPKDIKEEIVANYREINDFVAVGSSATAEDLPEASFAGQQSTYLNIRGKDDVIRHVQMCWASLYTARAIYYREKHGFKHADVLISVVVQRMVNSDCAGVMFTANPITDSRDEIIIEGNFGLGETVVSGMITPDSYIVKKEPFEITEKSVAKKRMGIFRGDDGNNIEREFDDLMATEQVLSDDEVKRLTEIGMKIEKHYDYPQDIEWAIEKGKIYITQSRPITTLK